MEQKIFITLRIAKKGKKLESWEFTDASNLTTLEKIDLFEEFIMTLKQLNDSKKLV